MKPSNPGLLPAHPLHLSTRSRGKGIGPQFAVFLAGCLCPSLLSASAQTQAANPGYTVVDAGLSYRVWHGTTSVTNATTGEITQQISSYTELDDGMYFWSNSVLTAAQDLIEVTPSGAQAIHGQIKANFSADITSVGAITLTTQGGDVFQSHPLGVFYFDTALGKVAQIAAVQTGQVTLYPPNVLVFSNLLAGLSADLMAVWAKNGYEQNLIIKSQPPTPESLGFSSQTTRVQLWTAMDSCPVPWRQRTFTLNSGLVDHVLDFGDCWFPTGSALAFGTIPLPPPGEAAPVRLIDPSAPDAVAAAKSLVNLAGLTVLVEEINYGDVQAMFAALPRTAMAPAGRTVVELADRGRLIPKPPPSKPQSRPVRVASSQYSARGLVWDYPVLTTTSNSITFTANSTYYIPGSFTVTASATFNTNACIKYASNATFTISEATVSFPSSGLPVVFTTQDDNGYGVPITNNTGIPLPAAAKELWIYNRSTRTTVQNVLFRWAQQAIHYTEETGAGLQPSLNSAIFQNCTTGVYLDIANDTLYLSGDAYCNVSSTINTVGGSVYGSITNFCGTPTDASKLLGLEGEPSIAINPANPQNLFIAANHAPQSPPRLISEVAGGSSTDGGATWTPFTVFPQSFADPSATFDTFSNLFVSFLVSQSNKAVVVLLSTDGGNSFATNHVFPGSYDHPEIATGAGSVWLTMYDFNASNSVATGAQVTGLGNVGTWTNLVVLPSTGPDALSAKGYGQGGIAVGPTGQVAVSVESNVNITNTPIRVSVNPSGLGGQFTTRSVVTNQLGFELPIPAEPRGINRTPSLAWDCSGGQYNGRLYMVYTDAPANNRTNTDIYAVSTDNDGTTWTSPLKINTDNTTTSQFFPRIAVDPTSGKVAASWYDCRADTNNNVKTQLYAAVSRDGGATFSSNNLRLETPDRSDATLLNAGNCILNGYGLGVHYGDYTGLAFYGGYFYSAWADNSTNAPGNLDGACGMDVNVIKVQY
jgi:hypothetical protein